MKEESKIEKLIKANADAIQAEYNGGMNKEEEQDIKVGYTPLNKFKKHSRKPGRNTNKQ